MAELGAIEPAAEGLAETASSVPVRPVVNFYEWTDLPWLMIDDKHLSVGWHNRPDKKGGPCYLVGRSGLTGGTKVVERFPFTEQGWSKAWRFLMRQDKTLAPRIRAELAKRAAAEQARAELVVLDASALANLLGVIFLGGYAADITLTAGQSYDLRFFSDQLGITESRQTTMLASIAYGEVEALEIGGPGVVNRLSRGQQAGLTLALGVLGAAIAYTDTKIQTIIRVQVPGGELHFLCTTAMPDAVRVQLSRPLGAIREARASKESLTTPHSERAAAAVGELSRLASLLETGLLTREEFDRLKTQLLAGS
jgi:hypothetical protein